MSTLDQWDCVAAEARETVEHKDADYGASWRLMRVTSLLDRIRTKLERVDQLLTQPEHKGRVEESVEDSLLDMVNESIFAVIQYRSWRTGRPRVGVDGAQSFAAMGVTPGVESGVHLLLRADMTDEEVEHELAHARALHQVIRPREERTAVNGHHE